MPKRKRSQGKHGSRLLDADIKNFELRYEPPDDLSVVQLSVAVVWRKVLRESVLYDCECSTFSYT